MDSEKRQKLDSDSLWTSLGDELARERQSLEDDRRELLAQSGKPEAEREAMARSGVTDGDILELNVGGETFAVQRGTLLVAPEDSHLHAMFSGRWEESLSRSKEGAIFVDMSPQVFRAILSRLRGSKFEAKPPTWGDLKASDPTFQYELQAVLKFFGLVDPISPFAMMACHSEISVVDDRVLQKNGGISHAAAVGSTAIAVGSAWKVRIISLVNRGWIFAGIIDTSATPSANSYLDPGSLGWAGNHAVYVGGEVLHKDYWVEWQHGDEAIFKLGDMSLKMYHARLERTFTLQLPPGFLWKVHFNMYVPGDKAEVSMATDQEVGIFG